MDSSKIHEETEECSSNESGWTMYIASPDRELDYDDYEDEEEYSNGGQTYTKDPKKDAHEDVDSDDSMASDASSGPSYQGHLCENVDRIHGSGHAGSKRGNKQVDKKHQQQERKKQVEQKKEAKDKDGNKKRSAAKSKNK
ncbi:uncharacterized protein [Primulina eburnea]|uniref:uncharacterized protein n=1 Tax=Primulina eburnea TaxID=1245227 RepID=UPI003C6C840D